MRVKVSELSGVGLDWAVAQVMDYKPTNNGWCEFICQVPYGGYDIVGEAGFSPSTRWEHGGPLIEREQINLEWDGVDGEAFWWMGNHQEKVQFQIGETPLIAACRAIVSAKLGDEIDLPEGLV